jgi:hypothetical protein
MVFWLLGRGIHMSIITGRRDISSATSIRLFQRLPISWTAYPLASFPS